MDVVYYIKKTSDDNRELRYSLRSLKNFKHWKVFIVWYKPKWCKGVVHIPCPDNEDKKVNAIKKVIKACEDKRLSNNFVMMNDDFYFIKEIEEIPVEHLWTLRNYIKINKHHEGLRYYEANKKVSKLFPNWHIFEPHTPCVFNKNLFLKMCNKFNINEGYTFRSLYYNYFKIKWVKITDVKAYNNQPFKIRQNQKYLSTDDNIMKEEVKEFMDNNFSESSDYEKVIRMINGRARSTIVVWRKTYEKNKIYRVEEGYLWDSWYWPYFEEVK